MPTYKPPYKGVSMSEAMAEAIAVAPIRRSILDTIEFYHPSFKDETGALFVPRIVSDNVPLTARLEPDAPRNAGQMVLFEALPLNIAKPAENDSAEAPEITFGVSGVSGELMRLFRSANQTIIPVMAIVREYASDDLEGPSRLPPLEMIVTNGTGDEVNFQVTARDTDPINLGFPSKLYLRKQYPGLSAK